MIFYDSFATAIWYLFFVYNRYQQTRQFDIPKRALQVLEVVLKGAYQQDHLRNGVSAARSFYLPNNKPEYLGDYFELWLGLFQSTVLGYSPYLNVDIAHKAFPKRYASLAHLVEDIKNESRNVRDERSLNDELRKHLKGLDLVYVTPGNANLKKIYKFLDLDRKPSEVRFKDDQNDGKETTVADYFKKRNFTIRYPDLPCVKIGSSVKSISVPMEHCELPGNQVSSLFGNIYLRFAKM